VQEGKGISMAGFLSWFIWRSAYLTRVVSWRNRFYVAINWLTTFVFGRDISRIWSISPPLRHVLLLLYVSILFTLWPLISWNHMLFTWNNSMKFSILERQGIDFEIESSGLTDSQFKWY